MFCTGFCRFEVGIALLASLPGALSTGGIILLDAGVPDNCGCGGVPGRGLVAVGPGGVVKAEAGDGGVADMIEPTTCSGAVEGDTVMVVVTVRSPPACCTTGAAAGITNEAGTWNLIREGPAGTHCLKLGY